MAEPPHANPIFDGVFFAIIRGGAIDDERETELKSKLTDNGAIECPLSSEKLKNITHLIADNAEFPAFRDAVDAYIHVVRPSWVDQSLWKKRISNPRQFSPDPAYFLVDANVVIAEDIPPHDRECLVGGILAMGGQYSTVMTKLVTHVIALTMENPQCQIIADKSLRSLPVLPHWLDHCFLLGRRIKETPYLLPEPPILDYDREGTLKYLKAENRAGESNIQGAVMLEARPLQIPEPVSPSKSRKQLTVFRNHAVLLGEDLTLNASFRNTLTEIIENGGGQVVRSREDADTIIVSTRRGLNFQHAIEHRKDVGSLNWLYHLINTNTWTDPLRKLLHYPVPYLGIGGFNNFKISVSNYAGDARIYLESLIKAAGCTFTKTLTQENTHLITAHTFSDKVDAAREWDINVVNHLWLEESYGGWTIKSVSEPKYTTFPGRTHLSEIVGQTPIDLREVEKFIFPHREPRPTRAGRPEPLEPSSSNVQSPFHTPATADNAGRVEQGTPNPANTSDKENAESGGRGAKNRALNKLHSMAPDIALFHKEMKRKGGVIHGGRIASDPARNREVAAASGLKRHRSADNEDKVASDVSRGVQNTPTNKRKKSTPPSDKLHIMVTSGDRFAFTADKSRKLRALGLVEVDDPDKSSKIDVLVSHKILKTPKFFAAVAAGAEIVAPGWIDATLERKEAVGTDRWILKDPDAEKDHNFVLQDALSRARTNKAHDGLFYGMTIYCTDNVQHGIDPWQKMVEWNGGKCLPYRGRDPRLAPAGADADPEPSKQPSLYLITVAKDDRYWNKFRKTATESGYRPALVTHEWLIRVCMTQDLSVWDPAWDLQASKTEVA
ncbi:MAG: hypothetical protein Q9159_000666 [Coniocarpon cinnabarinum]